MISNSKVSFKIKLDTTGCNYDSKPVNGSTSSEDDVHREPHWHAAIRVTFYW